MTVFGASSQTNGQYTVTLDSQTNPKVFDAQHDEVNTETVLYYADNLGPGTHSLVLTNRPAIGAGQQLWIEAANITTARSNR